jgi:uncharacterized membrane protein
MARNVNVRLGRDYDAPALMQQKYQALGFWGTLLTIGLVLLGLTAALLALANPGVAVALAVLVVVGVVLRFLIGVARLYYQQVYGTRRR